MKYSYYYVLITLVHYIIMSIEIKIWFKSGIMVKITLSDKQFLEAILKQLKFSEEEIENYKKNYSEIKVIVHKE